MTAENAKKKWSLYGGIIEKEIKKTTTDDLLFWEQKFNDLITKRKQELGIK